jgi:2-keto-4-pentenoate hydratase/2-oxohepta-3-ene-1,7-dioic acid hydratase in catechol pathway
MIVTGDLKTDSMIDLLAAIRRKDAPTLNALEAAKEPLPSGAVDLLPFEPRSFRDFMLYEQHVIDAGRGLARRFLPGPYKISRAWETVLRSTFPPFRPNPLWFRQPIYYFGNHLNMVTDGDAVDWPGYTDALDYELELAAVLCAPLKNATPKQALDAIGGFVVLNDFSARDVQLAEMRSGFGPQKAKHFLNAISATVVTADALLPEIDKLAASVKINDKVVCETTSAGAKYSFGEVLAHASAGEQLHAGELFGSGTLPGGSGMESGNWLAPGDTITLHIEKLGSLTNTIGKR